MGGPQGGPTQRLNELLDNIRTEFETESQRSVEYEGQSESRLDGRNADTSADLTTKSLSPYPRNRNDPRQGLLTRAAAQPDESKVCSSRPQWPRVNTR